MRIEADIAAPALASLLEQIDSLREQVDEVTRSLKPHTEPESTVAVAAIAHDLRSTLAAVHGYSSAALRRPDDAEFARHALAACQSAATRASEILSTLATNAPSCIKSAVTDCSVRVAVHRAVSIVLGSKPNLVTEYLPNLHELDSVRIEEGALVRVLQNVLLNAAEAAGDVPCRVAVSAGRVDGGWMRVSVSDNGPGIDRAKLPGLFRPKSGAAAGRGLGLWICRSLVEAAGGCISVETAAGKGTTFVILLPSGEGPAGRGGATRGAAALGEQPASRPV